MQTFESLNDARDAEGAGAVFSEIRRISDTQWHAYESGDTVPPEPAQDSTPA